VFVLNYLQQLPSRIERVRLTLTTGDWNGALDALLSLKTSSQMVGAERLAALGGEVEQSQRLESSRYDPEHVLPGSLQPTTEKSERAPSEPPGSFRFT
jgi:HPt (histidine-containing phosphotransfer) domain-containing protein